MSDNKQGENQEASTAQVEKLIEKKEVKMEESAVDGGQAKIRRKRHLIDVPCKRDMNGDPVEVFQ